MKTNLVVGLLLLVSTFAAAQGVSETTASIRHVVVVVEENHSYEDVVANRLMPYFNHLAGHYSLASSYYANAHDSIPNYFWLAAGAPVTYNDNTRSSFDVDNIVRHLMVSGLTWKAYAESLPRAGYVGYNTGRYVKRHNPFPYFTDVANSSERMNIVPFDQFIADSKNGQLPNLSFVVPNLVHDAHDGSLKVADAWLRLYIKPLFETPAFQPGGDGLLIIVFDESHGRDCRPSKKCKQGDAPFGGRTATIFAGPGAKLGTVSTQRYYHENLLSTICYALEMKSCPGKGKTASPMTDMLR